MTCFVSLFLCILLLPCLRKSISRLNHFPFSEVLYVRAKAAESDFKILVPIGSCERPPEPPTFWNSYTRTLILDTIMKLSGTIGVTQKTMTLDTHVRLILLQTLNPQER